MRKTYICSSQLQDQVKDLVLQDQNYTLGSSVHPEAYLFKYQDPIELDFSVHKKLQSLKLNVLKDTIQYPKTSKTLINFRKEMFLLNISCDELPTNTDVEKEIKFCLESITDLFEKAEILNSNDFVIPNGLNYPAHAYTEKNHLIMNHDVEIESLRYHYAQNKRQEVEAMVQDILHHDIQELSIAVPNKQDYLPLIESVLLRYGVKDPLENRKIKLLRNQFSSFLSFIHEANHRNFMTLLKHNCFLLNNPQDVLKYVEHYQLSFEDPLNQAYCVNEKADIYSIQLKIQDDLVKVQEIINSIETLTYLEGFEFIFNFYKTFYPDDILVFKAYYENYHPFITQENHSLIIEHFKSFKGKTSISEHWQIFDYDHLPIKSHDTLYCLGLNASNYPNINSLNGIIDEDYVQQIAKYPSLKERSTFELQAKRKIYSLAKHTVFSYHRSNYEGKGLEAAFEVKAFCETHGVHESLWPLEQIRYRRKRKGSLNPTLAKNLFSKDGIIYGSVSSLQKYANDPLQYFFENGLKLKEDQDISFNPMVFGNLNHEIVETNDYDRAWEKHIGTAFPKNSRKIKLIKDRNHQYMKENIDYLNEAKKHTIFKPYEFEKKVKTTDIFDKVELLGYVDRIDVADDYFVIIDYKSSTTNLSEPLVKEGKQLQLLTYASIIEEAYHKKPMAVFYYSFSHPSSISAGKYDYKTSQGISLKSEIDYVSEWQNEKRFKGWFFEDPQNYFSSDIYWTGLSTRAGDVTSRTKNVYDFKVLKSLLQDIYKSLYKNIASGILDIDEIEIDLDEDIELKKEIR